MSRNIVLVTVDSLRADHCSFIGYERETTPTLDAMADDGVVFENAVAPGPSTPESMPTIFTGEELTDVRHGVASRDRIRKHLSRYRSLPQRLSAAGYSTVGFTPNPFTSRYFGFDDGFDHFEDFLSTETGLRTAIVSRWMHGQFVAGLRFGLNMIGRGDVSQTWEDYYSELIETVDAATEPFFLWVFLLEPHWPYRPPSRYRDGVTPLRMYRANWTTSNFSDREPSDRGVRAVRSLYDGAIRHVDEFVDRLTTGLERADPVFVFHADHGEAFGEHGSFGHGSHLYEENVHVPLFIANAGRRDRVEAPISLRTLPALLESLAESSTPVDWSRFTDPWVRSSTAGKDVVRGRSWKLLQTDAETTFFDLTTDPQERRPRTSERLAALWEDLMGSSDRASERERIGGATRQMEVTAL